MLDVLAHRVLAGLAHTESSVVGLPTEALSLRPSLVQEMNVIAHAIDAERNPAELANNAAKVRVKVGLDLRANLRRSVTSAKDEMDENVRSRMAHSLTPLWGWLAPTGVRSHGLRRGLYSCGASRLLFRLDAAASLRPIRPVQASVLDRLCNMLRPERGYVLQIGNGAGNFQNAIAGARAKSLLRHRPFDQALAVRRKLAEATDVARDPICALQ